MKKRECYLVGGGLGNTGVAWARRAVAALVSQGQAGPGSSAHIHKDATMVGFREKSGKSDQMPYFSQILVGFLGHQRNLEEFSSNSEIYLHDNV